MTTINKQQTLQTILDHRVSAIMRSNSRTSAHAAMRAAQAGGFRLLEFTLTTPDAFGLIAEFSADADLTIGAGTVLTVEDAQKAVDAGARFLVSPIADPEIIDEAQRLNAVMIPGCVTPNEMVMAQRAGADLIKYFPASGNVAEYVRSIMGPLPTLRIFPTSGATPENFIDILIAGAVGVGFVRSLFTDDDMKNENYAAIERRAAKIIEDLNDWRGSH